MPGKLLRMFASNADRSSCSIERDVNVNVTLSSQMHTLSDFALISSLTGLDQFRSNHQVSKKKTLGERIGIGNVKLWYVKSDSVLLQRVVYAVRRIDVFSRRSCSFLLVASTFRKILPHSLVLWYFLNFALPGFLRDVSQRCLSYNHSIGNELRFHVW